MNWQKIKDIVKGLIPGHLLKTIRPIGHGLSARLASLRYANPSNKLIVIGITGTAGKSTTINLLGHILNGTGNKCGFITTANYSYGNETYPNKHGLSMPSEFLLQKQLKLMVERGCKYAILECTSEGLAQNRHLGINFDIALFTNISPAHIQAHGNFENYRAAKGRLFEALSKSPKKSFLPKKIIGVNLDDTNSEFFANFRADTKFGISTKAKAENIPTYVATNIQTEPTIAFEINSVTFKLNLFGHYNIYNALLAIALAAEIGIPLTQIAETVTSFNGVRGRMEKVPNNKGFTIFIDYAPEPKPMEEALTAIEKLPHNRIIHVFGSTGGHRDVQKRFEFGKITAVHSDIVIITNDDVYDSDPAGIAKDIREGIEQIPLEYRKTQHIKTILNRREAIIRALETAHEDDIIIFTGKGSEQFLMLPDNKRIDWDERRIIEEELTHV